MDVEVQRRTKSLDEGDCTRPGRVVCIACFLDQMRGNHAVDDAQHQPHDLGLAGKQKAQWKRETQHPLAHGLLRQYLVDQQRRTFGHPTRPATGTKSTALTAEGNQAHGVTRLAAHPQKAVFQPAAFEVVLEFSLYTARQLSALLRSIGSERRVVLFDDPIEKGLLGTVALITTSTPVPAGHPGRHLGHDPRTCVSVFLESLRQFAGS